MDLNQPGGRADSPVVAVLTGVAADQSVIAHAAAMAAARGTYR